MEMKRGDIVLCVIAGDYGKPRPAVIVQANLFNVEHPSIALLPITSYLIETPLFRIPIQATKANGVTRHSQVMVDKITAVRRDHIRERIGKISPSMLTKIDAALLRFLGFDVS